MNRPNLQRHSDDHLTPKKTKSYHVHNEEPCHLSTPNPNSALREKINDYKTFKDAFKKDLESFGQIYQDIINDAQYGFQCRNEKGFYCTNVYSRVIFKTNIIALRQLSIETATISRHEKSTELTKS